MQYPPTSSHEEHVAELLSAYIDNRLTPVERLQVSAHLTDCPSCRAQLASLQATVALLHELPVVPIPRPFYVYAEETPARSLLGVLRGLFAPGWAYSFLRLATSAAALLLVVLVSVDALGVSAPRSAAPAPATYGVVSQTQTALAPETAADRGIVPGAAPAPMVTSRGATAATPPVETAVPAAPPVYAAPFAVAPAPAAATPAPAAPTSTQAPAGASVPPGATPPLGLGMGPPSIPPTASVGMAPTPMGGGLTITTASPTPAAGPLAPKAAGTPPPASADASRGLTSSLALTPSVAPQELLTAPGVPTAARQAESSRATALPEPSNAAPAAADEPGDSPVRLGEVGLAATVIILLTLTLLARRTRRSQRRD